MSDKNNSKDFESSLEKLEEIVAELESGDLPLEKSIKAFEEGIKLTYSRIKDKDTLFRVNG